MPLGWIDFSKTERSKILTVLDMLTEAGTLDELGISPVRDGFSNLFFPGTSTIQTRAKYFFAVPYALKELEKSSEGNPNKIFKALDEKERECGELFLTQNADESGVIGKRSLKSGHWVKRAPSDIYWAGLRQYGIFVGGRLSISEYIRTMCVFKNQKSTLKKLGNRHDNAKEYEVDDKDAGDTFKMQFWNMPLYSKDWFERLKMELTQDEGAFIKGQIILSCPDSMLAYILKNDERKILDLDGFKSLQDSGIIYGFPEQIQKDYFRAQSFSDFIFCLRVIYNTIVSGGENEEANYWLEELHPEFKNYAEVDIDDILKRLEIFNNPLLEKFLHETQALMRADDMDALVRCIKDREIQLKGQSRAKTSHPGEFDKTAWFGGGLLDYRFSNAKVIMRDIFESEA